MPRHTQPREIAELTGAVAKNPQRYRNNPPKQSLGIGDAPEDMTPEEQACWFELVAMVPPGILTFSERPLMDALASLYAEYKEDRREFGAAKRKDFISLCARFGMSPADRQKLHVEKDEPEDEFEVL